MTKTAMFIILCLVSLSSSAMAADMPVRVNANGNIVDINGNVIAVANPTDPRNTDYDKYFVYIGPDGKPQDESSFFLYNTPTGYMKRSLADMAPPDEPEPTLTFATPATPHDSSTSTIELEETPGMPVYGNMQSSTGERY